MALAIQGSSPSIIDAQTGQALAPINDGFKDPFIHQVCPLFTYDGLTDKVSLVCKKWKEWADHASFLIIPLSKLKVRIFSRYSDALLAIYKAANSSNLEETQAQWNALPEEIRKKIYEFFNSMKGSPQRVEGDQKNLDHGSLSILQKVIQKLAYEAFDDMCHRVRDSVIQRMCILSGGSLYPKDQIDFVDEMETFAKENPEILIKNPENLLQALSDFFRNDLSAKEIETILDVWVAEGAGGTELRSSAKEEILHFVNKGSSLVLENLGLSSLPPIFHADVFVRRLDSLCINDNCLTTLPSEIGLLRSLKSLVICGKNITSLPLEIFNLRDLTELGIIKSGLKNLPPEIGNLTALQGLFIHNNHFTALPPEIGQLMWLGVLDASNNHLTAIPGEIGHLTGLRMLQLENNLLHELPAEVNLLTELSVEF